MNERLQGVLKNPWTIPVGVGVTAFGGGLGLGYILWGRKTDFEKMQEEQLEFDYDTIDVEDVAESRAIIDKEKYDSPAVAPETDVEVTDDSVVIRVPATAQEPELEPPAGVDVLDEEPAELITRNVFEDEDWDWELEIAKREAMTEPGPYILHRDEFYRDEMDFAQLTLRYFPGDAMMVDEDDQIIPNYPAIVGPLMFGHGANTADRFYVRNEDRKAEYEVLLEEGHYSVQILGLEAEERAMTSDLRHSNQVGKFRMD